MVAPCSLRMAANRFLVVVLPFEPVIADDAQPTGFPHPRDDLAGQIRQGQNPVRHDDLRQLDVQLPLHDEQRGSVLACVLSEQMAVRDLPGQRDEYRAGTDQPRVGLDGSGDLERRVGRNKPPADHGRERPDGDGDHAQPASCRAARASSRAEYAVRTPRMSR